MYVNTISREPGAKCSINNSFRANFVSISKYYYYISTITLAKNEPIFL